ncbi:MAG: DUF5103 domain-containing protein [Tannerellaceae bacterium]|jgi:hypothetical protein|nr:DUF5103 domain-containing protein [Tannerellaceae bacterium]
MKRFWICLFWITGISSYAFAQVKYDTRVNTNQIYTLQVKVAGAIMSEPVISFDGDERIEINFDATGHNYNRFAYSIVHCDADWVQSALTPIEYMNGFQGLTIDDFAASINTTTQYTNYILQLPNDDVQFKTSGNYAVCIYKENEPDKILFTACFSIVEPLVTLSAGITGNTMTDFNREHQQLNFTINHAGVAIAYPQTDLKIYAYQNNRRDNAVTNLKPTTILKDQLIYNNNRDLIFEAGNEYRRIEFLTNKYNGMGVANIEFHNPFYNVELMTDRPRSRDSYLYDQDQNGRYFIRCSSCSDPDTEADYYIVHFTVACDPFLNGAIHLHGNLLNNALDEKSKMGYNFETNQYEKSILLKQGSYNYQYVFIENGTNQGQSGVMEGNNYQTENEYSIYVYYRPMGTRYDRLIGATTIKNKMDVF